MKRIRILVVDDEPAVRHVASRLLRAAGYVVLTAGGGDEALRMADRHRGDLRLLITDISMPGLGGVALAERMVRMEPSLKVLYASGYPAGTRSGPDPIGPGVDFIAKPFTAADLVRKVREVLTRSGHPGR